jgi:hypothetical protein
MTLQTELDLSPFVQDYWRSKGYCVHGEVAVFKASTFIDHVAHTGPCSCPEHVVGIEMKKGAGKDLRKQLVKLDRKHLVDEIWGAVISTPREATLDEWDDLGRWIRPGLLVWENGKLVEVRECAEVKAYQRKLRRERLLLVDENRDVLAGYPASHDDSVYVTHWKRVRTAAKQFALTHEDPFQVEDLKGLDLPELGLYKNPDATLMRALRELEEVEHLVRQIGKDHGKPLFQKLTAEKDDLIDTRFMDWFDL